MKKQHTSLVIIVLLLLTIIKSSAQVTYPETIEKGAGYTIGTAIVPLLAKQSIVLKSGVWIQKGAVFTAKIEAGSYDIVSPDTNQNYIYTRSYQTALNNYTEVSQNKDLIEQITYVDGLGRSIQQINIKQGPQAQDIVTRIEYDDYGRQALNYLPYPKNTIKKGSFNNGSWLETREYYRDQYPTEMNPSFPNPYTENEYDGSPLNRITKQAFPGETWKIGSGHEIKHEQDVNTLNEVYKFELINGIDQVQILNLSTQLDQKYYPAGSLFKTIVKDENHSGTTKNNTTEEFANSLGQVVLKRTYADTQTQQEVPHDTYYVYDDFGNLTYVIPPLVNIEELIQDEQEIFQLENNNQFTQEVDFNSIVNVPGVKWFEISKLNNVLRIYISGYFSNIIIPESVIQINKSSCQLLNFDLGYIPTLLDGINNTGAYSAIIEDGLFKIIRNENIEVDEIHFDISLPIPNTCEIVIYPVNQQLLNDLCYQYKYDAKNRLIEKKIPGKDKEYIVYDRLDRPVLTQDAKQRATNQWQYVKYDIFNRPIETGTYTDNTNLTLASQQTNVNTQTIHTGAGSYPTINIEPQSKTYYDTYGFSTVNIQVPQDSYGVAIVDNTKGLVTGSKTKILGTNQWITTVNYYDKYGRVIYNYSQNDYLQTLDKTQTQYDFVGKPLKTKKNHYKTGQAPVIIEDTYTYDHAGRLTTQYQQINSEPQQLITNNTYDALGQLQNKKVGNTPQSPLQTIDYKYNIRGWLTHINNPVAPTPDDLFNFEIKYDKPTAGGTALYNGNISQTHWRTANQDNNVKQYNYSYDALNRLKTADFRNPVAPQDNKSYSEKLQYDKNGNITFLHRSGDVAQNPTLEWMDYMTYTYNGNQLQRISDAGHNLEGFTTSIPSTSTLAQYSYDSNGNLTKDTNKNITNISYNHLNLPQTIAFANGSQINYTYDASGIKQQKQVTTNGTTTTTQYAGAYTYKNTNNTPVVLEYITHPEGYITRENNIYQYVYQYKDHLGNIRLSYADNDKDGKIDLLRGNIDIDGDKDYNHEIIEENNYYPFGMKHKGYNNVVTGKQNKFMTFNGKEYEGSLGLNVVEMDFRQYDPAIGRFSGIDRLTELVPGMTPYRFAFNNPVKFGDPTGLFEQVNGESVGADGLTNSQWINSSRPGRNNQLANTYRAQNREELSDRSRDFKFPEGKVDWNAPGNSDESEDKEIFRIYDKNNKNVAHAFYASFFAGKRFEVSVGLENGIRDNNRIDKGLEWTGRFNDIMDSAGKVSMTATGKAVTRYTGPAGVAIGVAQIGRGYNKDKKTFGYHTQKASASFVGGLAGAWLGFEAGSVVGFEGGFVLGAAFGGVGAIPGAVLGGVVGGFVGGFGGAYYGGQFGESLIEK